MTKYYFIVKATNSDNVGDIEATDEVEALEKLNNIYAPADPVTGKPHLGIELQLISKSVYDSEKKRIEKTRYEEANATSEDNSEVIEG